MVGISRVCEGPIDDIIARFQIRIGITIYLYL